MNAPLESVASDQAKLVGAPTDHSPHSTAVAPPELVVTNLSEMSWILGVCGRGGEFGWLGPVTKNPVTVPLIGPVVKIIWAKAGALNVRHRIASSDRVAIPIFMNKAPFLA